jgi:hypothetical protein
LHDCSTCNWLGAAIPHLAGRNCSRWDNLWILFLWALTMAMSTPPPPMLAKHLLSWFLASWLKGVPHCLVCGVRSSLCSLGRTRQKTPLPTIRLMLHFYRVAVTWSGCHGNVYKAIA